MSHQHEKNAGHPETNSTARAAGGASRGSSALVVGQRVDLALGIHPVAPANVS